MTWRSTPLKVLEANNAIVCMYEACVDREVPDIVQHILRSTYRAATFGVIALRQERISATARYKGRFLAPKSASESLNKAFAAITLSHPHALHDMANWLARDAGAVLHPRGCAWLLPIWRGAIKNIMTGTQPSVAFGIPHDAKQRRARPVVVSSRGNRLMDLGQMIHALVQQSTQQGRLLNEQVLNSAIAEACELIDPNIDDHIARKAYEAAKSRPCADPEAHRAEMIKKYTKTRYYEL